MHFYSLHYLDHEASGKLRRPFKETETCGITWFWDQITGVKAYPFLGSSKGYFLKNKTQTPIQLVHDSNCQRNKYIKKKKVTK